MKQTDLNRRERELKKEKKKAERIEKGGKADRSVGDFMKELFGLFFYDAQKIYNLDSEENILILLEEIKDELPEKQWDNVLRKAIKQTKIAEKDEAFNHLKELMVD